MGPIEYWQYRRRLQRLMDAWQTYHTALAAVPGPGAVSPDSEGAFLTLKTTVMHLLPALAHVEDLAGSRGGYSVTRDICAVLERTPTLASVATLSPESHESLLRDWQASYLELHRIAGSGRPRSGTRARGQGSAPTGFYGSLSAVAHWPPLRAVTHGWLTRFVVKLALAATAVALLWRLLGRPARPPAASGAGPGSGQSGGAVAVAIRSVLDSLGELFGTVMRGIQPIVAKHETEATIFVAGVVLLGVAYVLFIRRV